MGLKMNKRALAAAFYFVAFESTYWSVGSRFFNVMRMVVFQGDFSWLQATGDIVMFVCSGPAVVLSAYFLARCWGELFKGMHDSTKEALVGVEQCP